MIERSRDQHIPRFPKRLSSLI